MSEELIHGFLQGGCLVELISNFFLDFLILTTESTLKISEFINFLFLWLVIYEANTLYRCTQILKGRRGVASYPFHLLWISPVSGTRTCTTQTNEFWLEMQTFAVKRQKDFTTPLVPPLHKNSIMISWDHSSLQFTQCSLHCRHNCNQDMFDLRDMRLSLQTTSCTGHMHTVLIHASLTAIAMPCYIGITQ